MDIASLSQNRYTTKIYDNTKKIPEDQIQQLCELLRKSPSSVNSQPWHFFIVHTEEGKKQILPGISEFNYLKITNASHIVVFCAKKEFTEEHLKNLLIQEEKDGRFANSQIKEQQDKSRRYFVELNSQSSESLLAWESKQIYIALGQLLLGAASLGISSTPIEGFSSDAMDQALGLSEKGLTSVVVASLGYHSEEDFNASLPKSRLSKKELFTFL